MGRDLLILALAALPSLSLGVVWMRQFGIPAAVYLQNVAAAVAGLLVAVYGHRRYASRRRGLAITGAAVVLLLATLMVEGVQSVHRWVRIGPLTFHVASLSIPLVLAELDRTLRAARLSLACGVILMIAAILAIQPDAGQATAFAGSSIVLLVLHVKRKRIAFAAILALLALAALSLLRADPLAPVPHVEEIAIRIAQQGPAWQVAAIGALALLIVPFVVPTVAASASAQCAVAVYLALDIAASYWGNFPVPVLGYGMSPILGYFAGWTWLRASNETALLLDRPRSA